MEIFGIPLAFILFAATLLGIAVLHRHALAVALSGLAVIATYSFAGQHGGLAGFGHHFLQEWVTLFNLFALLTGFSILARHFEKTRIPVILPHWLADSWIGGFQLLVLIFFISGFLDNIAAALIGAAMAHALFQGKLHVGYLAAIVAASNAGGAGSVIGDTTTTMMWLQGVSPHVVAEAYLPALVALVIFGIPASRAQQAFSPIVKDSHRHTHLDKTRLAIVAALLAAVIGSNLAINFYDTSLSSELPVIGLALWVVLVLSIPLRRPDWEVLPGAAQGALFLLALVLCASLMPVSELPAPSWQSTMGLGFISAVFDNIPLTALALQQGGYDWGFVAFAVGFGGSLLWFGSSAGVALAAQYPQARSVGAWLRHGWPIIPAYITGYLTLLLVLGWQPQ